MVWRYILWQTVLLLVVGFSACGERSPETNLEGRQALESAIKAKALQVVVATNKQAYRPGEEVTITLKLKNVADFPVVVTRSIIDGGLSGGSRFEVRRGDQRVDPTWEKYQLARHRNVDENRFLTLLPGKTVTLRTVRFAQEWDFPPGLSSRMKEDYWKAQRISLRRSIYKVKGFYSFAFNKAGIKRWNFSGKSRELLEQAWTGKLEAETDFEVR